MSFTSRVKKKDVERKRGPSPFRHYAKEKS
jgi:hypothetical protein